MKYLFPASVWLVVAAVWLPSATHATLRGTDSLGKNVEIDAEPSFENSNLHRQLMKNMMQPTFNALEDGAEVEAAKKKKKKKKCEKENKCKKDKHCAFGYTCEKKCCVSIFAENWEPSSTPTVMENWEPSTVPSSTPSTVPSGRPSLMHSSEPSVMHSSEPSMMHSSEPSVMHSSEPSAMHSSEPSMMHSSEPSMMHSSEPSVMHSSEPSFQPSAFPSNKPSLGPTKFPDSDPDLLNPSSIPSSSPTKAPTDTMATLISPDDNTERVTIPNPPVPSVLTAPRTGCPSEDGLIPYSNWHTLFPSLTTDQDVAIAENVHVLVTETIPTKLGLVTIPASSTLTFAENDFGIRMDAAGFDVQGSLIAGSETCRYETELTITLHGERPVDVTTTNPQRPSYKGISVEGNIELHGKRFYRTWTRLAQRVTPGDTSIVLQDQVNWESGQDIVLVTTAMRDTRDWHRNEVMTIDRVEPSGSGGSIVHLTAEVLYDHIARQEYQGEVGLLTRTIKVQGAEDSVPTPISQPECEVVKDTGSVTSVFGYKPIVCPNEYLDGFGGHIMVHGTGMGKVEGVELYRMGQTNTLGRYPMHFHLLGENCPGCYFKDSSVHESYYRCISVHATNGLVVSENVGYDITGFCYYLEDGVEEGNTLSYNLAAHVHFIGSPAIGGAQRIIEVEATADLTLPADVAASGFYITNLQNNITGNVASGGWAGFAFPILNEPNGPSATNHPDFSPRKRPTFNIDGNTAHSTAHFWNSAAAFYFGGSLYKREDDGKLMYNAGRDNNANQRRDPCAIDPNTGRCETAYNIVTNSKVYQVANVGLGSWSGEMEIHGFECHDCGLTMEALVQGFWVDDMVGACRTGETLALPSQDARKVGASGFVWYDTGQAHIISNTEFRNCGYRSDDYNQYDTSPTRGCGDDLLNGCHRFSSVWGLLSHSDAFNPEVMQATRGIVMTDVGRRFRMSNINWETVSGNSQNWDDIDGTVSGLNVPTLIGSGFETLFDDQWTWWNVDSDVVYDEHGPLYFIPKNDGASRGLAHVSLWWDDDLHGGGKIDSEYCFNGGTDYCPHLGSIRHLGNKFDSTPGLPVTAMPDIAGLAGGYGWLFALDAGSPKAISLYNIEVDPSTPLTFSIAYPVGTHFTITAIAKSGCKDKACQVSCEEVFTRVDTMEEVRFSEGNVYSFDETTGLLTIRVVMFNQRATGLPDWKLQSWDTEGLSYDEFALKRFERDGIRIPVKTNTEIKIEADCPTEATGIYCSGSPPAVTSYDDVCSLGYYQVSYDRCCLIGSDVSDPVNCEFSGESDLGLDPFAPSSAPTPLSASKGLFYNGDFEGGDVCPWWEGSDTYSVDAVSSDVGGGLVAYITGRTSSNHAIFQSVMGRFEFDVSYDFSMDVKLAEVAEVQAQVRIKYADGTTKNDRVIKINVESAGVWTHLSATKTFTRTNASDILSIQVVLNTPSSTADLWVDNLSMVAQDATPI